MLGWAVARGYHLLQLPFASRRARVLADWTAAAVFRRDVAELSVTAPSGAGAREGAVGAIAAGTLAAHATGTLAAHATGMAPTHATGMAPAPATVTPAATEAG